MKMSEKIKIMAAYLQKKKSIRELSDQHQISQPAMRSMISHTCHRINPPLFRSLKGYSNRVGLKELRDHANEFIVAIDFNKQITQATRLIFMREIPIRYAILLEVLGVKTLMDLINWTDNISMLLNQKDQQLHSIKLAHLGCGLGFKVFSNLRKIANKYNKKFNCDKEFLNIKLARLAKVVAHKNNHP